MRCPPPSFRRRPGPLGLLLLRSALRGGSGEPRSSGLRSAARAVSTACRATLRPRRQHRLRPINLLPGLVRGAIVTR